ncbi:MAG: hypothetical protein U9R19_18125 [Bacteroidota bacterium]|nr:hypothetical protein [Bacteroidota bacterium]
MRNQIAKFIMLIAVLAYLGNVDAQTDSCSMRIKSLGVELKWIVDDEYTDIFHNPASINALSSNWLITNLSNQAGNNHQFLNYEENAYQAGSGSYLFGSFYSLSDWNLGFVGNYWKDKRWESKALGMHTGFSYGYDFNWYYDFGNEEGFWVTDYNNETETLSDDWRVTEERYGANYYADGAGLDLTFIVGRKNLGLTYRFVRSASNSPLEYLHYAYHSYNLMEVGSNAPIESVSALQEETNEYKNENTGHHLSLGWTKKLGEKTNIDFVASLNVLSSQNSNESKREKLIDYDPDNDNISHGEYWNNYGYDQYHYQGLQSYNSNLAGLGYGFDARISKTVSSSFQWKMLGGIHYRSENSDSYKSIMKEEQSMTSFISGNEFDNSVDTGLSGEQEQNCFRSLAGAGAVFNPQENFLIAFGLKWYHYNTEIIYDLDANINDDNQNFDDETINRLDRVSLPFGCEYIVKEKYAFRLGVNTNFYSGENTTSQNGIVISDLFTQNSDITTTTYNKHNLTYYSYGFGYKLNKNIDIDFTGITNITDISNLFISILYRF